MQSEHSQPTATLQKNLVASIHYRLTDAEGSVLEHTDQEPMSYLHGHDNLLNTLEIRLEGMGIGETRSVTLSPADAYGERREGLTQRVPAKHIIDKPRRLAAGDVVHLSNTQRQIITATVLKVGKFMVDVDLNHPYAGKTLTFDVTLVDLRAAHEEELAHGHAHGPGGHHH